MKVVQDQCHDLLARFEEKGEMLQQLSWFVYYIRRYISHFYLLGSRVKAVDLLVALINLFDVFCQKNQEECVVSKEVHPCIKVHGIKDRRFMV